MMQMIGDDWMNDDGMHNTQQGVHEMKVAVNEQLEQLQVLMRRMAVQRDMERGGRRDPYRGQGRVLAMLKMKPEISQKELTYLLGMRKQSLAELLAKLERGGYITRAPAEEDKRIMTIKLTEEGMKTADDLDDDSAEASLELDCLSDGELSQFSDYLGRIIKRFEAHFPDEDFEARRRMVEAFTTHHGRGRMHGGRRGGHGRRHGGHGYDKEDA